MTTKNFICLAVLAGLGLSACSNTPSPSSTASIPEAGELHSSVLAQMDDAEVPAAEAISQPQQVAQALALDYTPHYKQAPRLPVAHSQRQPVVPHYGFAPTHTRVAMQRPARPHIPTFLPGQRPRTNNGGMPQLSKAELTAIGQQIFINEGGGSKKRLVHWNVGEDFASMGIGHFLWYPSGRKQSFGNTFPGLLDYMSSRGVQLPGWLQQARRTGAPWRSRAELLRASNSHQVRELQTILYNTRDIQAEYIVNRARRAMPRLVKASAGSKQQHVARNLNAVANTPGGWYALIDYVNFKGEGLGGGGYKGYSWGLRQVLEEMRPSQPGQQALHEFADAAMRVLQRRVRNSDPRRNEKKWLPGWRNRVNTYRNPIV